MSWAVTWKRKPIALPFLIDADDPEIVAEITIRLHSIPNVYDVAVTHLDGAEMDEETKKRIKQRIADRINYEWAVGVNL